MRRLKIRPHIEELENRVVPALYHVVPAGTEDNVTTFATLQGALDVPTLGFGDTIQIETGSTPGSVQNTTTENNLTIQTNPSLAIPDRPKITMSFTVAANQFGMTFRNLNITGVITAAESMTISGCQFDNAGGANTSVFSGPTNIFTGNTFTAKGGTSLISLNLTGPTANIISGNTFEALNIGPGGALLSLNASSGSHATDVISNNTFVNQFIDGAYVMLRLANNIDGVTVRDNVFDAPVGQSLSAIATQFTANHITIQGNRISMAHGGGIGVIGDEVPEFTRSSSVVVNGNTIVTPDSVGLYILTSVSEFPLFVSIQGNTFAGCKIGIRIDTGTASGPIGGISLGDPLSSLGGNDFRSFTQPATADAGAIVVTGMATGFIPGEGNAFATGVDPSSAVFAGEITFDLNAPLTGNAAFVAALYSQILHRAGDMKNPQDAGMWVAALDHGASRDAVVVPIVRSPEAVAKLVDSLYVQVLGRPADPVGREGWGAFLLHGGTYAETVAGLINSAEFATKFGSESNQIEQMYRALLGREASEEEIAGWLAVYSSGGQIAVVSGIVQSVEFRTIGVNQLYGTFSTKAMNHYVLPDLLHRGAATPPQSDIDGLVNSGLDLLAIEIAFASSGEYFTNG